MFRPGPVVQYAGDLWQHGMDTLRSFGIIIDIPRNRTIVLVQEDRSYLISNPSSPRL